MSSFAGTLNVSAYATKLAEDLRGSSHLQDAAQRCVSRLYDDFTESMVLARLYAILPMKRLPERDQGFVTKLAEANNQRSSLREDTPILTLLGTRGRKQPWNQRYDSNGHLGIPLLSAQFVEAIPMVCSLLRDVGLGLDWLDDRKLEIVVSKLGKMAGVFYVADAREAVDAKGRKIVPAADFVNENGVRTVFGLGGAYMNGVFVATILFTKEAIEKPKVEMLMPLINVFKTETLDIATKSRFFNWEFAAGLGFKPDVVIVKVDYQDTLTPPNSFAVLRSSTMAGDATKVLLNAPALTADMIQSLESVG